MINIILLPQRNITAEVLIEEPVDSTGHVKRKQRIEKSFSIHGIILSSSVVEEQTGEIAIEVLYFTLFTMDSP